MSRQKVASVSPFSPPGRKGLGDRGHQESVSLLFELTILIAKIIATIARLVRAQALRPYCCIFNLKRYFLRKLSLQNLPISRC